jgi:hypothetical protein
MSLQDGAASGSSGVTSLGEKCRGRAVVSCWRVRSNAALE